MFYTQFEVANPDPPAYALTVLHDVSFTVSVGEEGTINRINTHKAVGSDRISDVLKACIEQLSAVLTDIVLVPKKSNVTCLNNYRPVALTSVAIKCLRS